MSRQCESFLSPPFSFQISDHSCLLRDIAYDMLRTICRGSVNAAFDFTERNYVTVFHCAAIRYSVAQSFEQWSSLGSLKSRIFIGFLLQPIITISFCLRTLFDTLVTFRNNVPSYNADTFTRY